MPHDDLIQNESLLHWMWQSLHFDLQALDTRTGQTLEIIDPGYLNTTDGPDFLSARILINTLEWYGSVELHLYEQDWYNHFHHQDPAYNNVVLHVILFANASRPIHREDGTRPFTLCLKPHLPSNMIRFVQKFNKDKPQKYLPCSRHAYGILRDDLFQRQLTHAHTAYYYQKVFDQYAYWDANLAIQKAWRRMQILSLFDGLGISHNRESMKRLAAHLFDYEDISQTRNRLIQRARRLANLPDRDSDHTVATTPERIFFNWNTKSVRPANRPSQRIKQGVYLLKKVMDTPFEAILQASPTELWQQWTTHPDIPGLGQRRSKILMGISLIPCLKVAADLQGNRARSRQLRRAWNQHHAPIPKSFHRILDKTLINPDIYARCLGTVYQLRHYCFRHRCRDCLVFQKAFSS